MAFCKGFFGFLNQVIGDCNEFGEILVGNIGKRINDFFVGVLKRNGILVKIFCVAKSLVDNCKGLSAVFDNVFHKAVVCLAVVSFVIILDTQKEIFTFLLKGCFAGRTNKLPVFIAEISVFTFRTNDSYHTSTLTLSGILSIISLILHSIIP